MPSVRIYHNPKCSKSRQTLALLQANGIEPEIIEYLKTPLSADALKTLLKQLGMNATALLRQKEPEYRSLNLANATEAAAINAMIAHPKLMERPIVVKGQRAVIGRPPETVLELC